MTFSREQLDRFRDIITQRLGIRVEGSNLEALADLLRLRMQVANRKDVESYLLRLAGSAEEIRAIASHVTVAETYFFRIPDHFRALAETVVPERLRAKAAQRQLRILSAGCASGEELYSMAMLLREHFDLSAWEVTLLGVDVNPAKIAQARQARYTAWALRETPPEFRDRCFRRQGAQFQLDESIRNMVSFAEGNLADARPDFWQANAYDIILFRNVLMYFSPEATQAAVARMATALVTGGYLFLGPAETLRGVSHDFHLCHTEGAFYYRCREKGTNPIVSGRHSTMSPPNRASTLAERAIPPEVDGGWFSSIQAASERIAELTCNTHPRHRPGLEPSVSTRQAAAAVVDVALALELLKQDRFAEALDALQAPVGDAPPNPDVELLRAVLLANGGKPAEAEKACELLLKSDDLNAGAYYVIALCREHAGDNVAAAEHDRTAMYLDGSFAMPHLHFGLMAKRRGELNTARHELAQALRLLAGEDSARILLFGGGFSREALVELCRRELLACGGPV